MSKRRMFDIITNKRVLQAMQKVSNFTINSDGTVIPLGNRKFIYKGTRYSITQFDIDGPFFVTRKREDKNMYIVLKPNAHRMLSPGVTRQGYIDFIKSLEGQYLPVDTDYLFADSFNMSLVSEDVKKENPRVTCTHIPAMLVDRVINDKRKDRKRCNNCGRHSVYKDAKGRIYKSCPYCKSANTVPFNV